MAGFTDLRWQQITDKLNQNPAKFGLPVRRSDSVVIASFNALKLGKDTNSAKLKAVNAWCRTIRSRYPLNYC